MKYDFNIPKSVKMMIPAFMRGLKQVDWLISLTHPVVFVHGLFTDFINATDKRLKWNGQSISLKYLLQDKFGGDIEVVNQNQTARPFYVYGAGDTRNPAVFNPGNPKNPIAIDVNEFDPEAVDFIINVTSAVVPDEPTKDEMIALVKEYKLHSKRFKITLV
ncbi:MAG: hypothetical protein HEP71_00600 [Roseivirga sp.]|nr:hypothetical protein [Roseivirga sp.]